jgi:hypothetical protein
MPVDKTNELERRVEALERRLDLVEEGYVDDERRRRRARSLNMWLRLAVYVSFLLLMVLFLVVLKVRF